MIGNERDREREKESKKELNVIVINYYNLMLYLFMIFSPLFPYFFPSYWFIIVDYMF